MKPRFALQGVLVALAATQAALAADVRVTDVELSFFTRERSGWVQTDEPAKGGMLAITCSYELVAGDDERPAEWFLAFVRDEQELRRARGGGLVDADTGRASRTWYGLIAEPGSYEVGCVADPDGELAESDEGNNRLVQTLSVPGDGRGMMRRAPLVGATAGQAAGVRRQPPALDLEVTDDSRIRRDGDSRPHGSITSAAVGDTLVVDCRFRAHVDSVNSEPVELPAWTARLELDGAVTKEGPGRRKLAHGMGTASLEGLVERWTPTEPGHYVFRCLLDPAGAVAETTRSNNLRELAIDILPAGGEVVAAAPPALPGANLAFAAIDPTKIDTTDAKAWTMGPLEKTLYKPALDVQLIWQSPQAAAFQWRWQVSLWPFPRDPGVQPEALLAEGTVAGNMLTSDRGLFLLDLGSIPPFAKTPSSATEGPPGTHGATAIKLPPPETQPDSAAGISDRGAAGTRAAPPPSTRAASQSGRSVVRAGEPRSMPARVRAGGTSTTPGASANPAGTAAIAEPVPMDLAMDLHIRLIPTKAGQPAGPPSNAVVAHYLPGSDPHQAEISEAVTNALHPPAPFDVVKIDVDVPPAPNPNLASCVRIVSETPRFPLTVGYMSVYVNPDGSTVPGSGGGGTKITGALPYTLQNGAALYPFTACPGERANFQWGDVGCGANLLCHAGEFFVDVTESAVEAGEFLADLANGIKEAYDDLKSWTIDQVATVVCPSAAAAECKTMINVGVDAALTSVGVPPTLPSFDDVATLAKGEIVDVALDQLGVGAACDAVAMAGAGKSCGELAVALQDLDACSLAPKGQEDTCKNVLAEAEAACQLASGSEQCKLLTTNAQVLVKAGFENAIEQSIATIEERVTNESMQALGFWSPEMSSLPYYNHYCDWSGPDGTQVICPPDTAAKVKFGADVPGCWLGQFGADDGKVVCSKPPARVVATPEPFGQRQPIKVQVHLKRNENPLPPNVSCKSISAVVTAVAPSGASGEPYLPATATIKSFANIHRATLWFKEPGPDAQALLAPGSALGVRILGPCVPETQAEGASGVVGVIGPPRPRIAPGTQDAS